MWHEWLPIEFQVVETPDVEVSLCTDRKGPLTAVDLSDVLILEGTD